MAKRCCTATRSRSHTSSAATPALTAQAPSVKSSQLDGAAGAAAAVPGAAASPHAHWQAGHVTAEQATLGRQSGHCTSARDQVARKLPTSEEQILPMQRSGGRGLAVISFHLKGKLQSDLSQH